MSFFSCVFDEIFTEMSKFHEASPALKNFWLRACIVSTFKLFADDTLLFGIVHDAKTSVYKLNKDFWMGISVENAI